MGLHREMSQIVDQQQSDLVRSPGECGRPPSEALTEVAEGPVLIGVTDVLLVSLRYRREEVGGRATPLGQHPAVVIDGVVGRMTLRDRL
jgi:hypothetical protein